MLDRADDARVTAAKTDIANIVQQLKMYRWTTSATHGRARPAGAHQASPPAPFPTTGSHYLTSCPMTLGPPYQYLSPGIKGEIDVMSFGADGNRAAKARTRHCSWQ